MEYLKKCFQACYNRTLPWVDLDNDGERHDGMSWPRSIGMMFYFWFRKLKRKLSNH